MANISEKKRKMLILLQILWEKTDENHALTLPELLQELDSCGVPAERKSIYDDIETLRSVGFSIETRKQKTFQYYLSSRKFTFSELQLLTEAAVSLPEGKELCRKLGTLGSSYQREKLAELAVPAPKPAAEEKITLEFPSDQLEAVKTRFGAGIATEPAGKSHLRTSLRAELSPELLGWLFCQSPAVRLVSPKKLAEQLRERARSMAKLYKS